MNELPPLKYLVFRDFVNDFIPDILDEIYIKKIYYPYVIGRKNLTIVDFGANQGIVSSYFYPYAKNLFAVEPAKQHLEVLTKLKELNKMDNMTICPYAISTKDETHSLHHSKNPTAFMIVDNILDPKLGEEKVSTITLSTFFKTYNIDKIDILKLDIEGMEGKLIASEEFETLCPKINIILGEYHEWCGVSKNLFANRLTDLGYEFKWRNDTKAACFEAVRV